MKSTKTGLLLPVNLAKNLHSLMMVCGLMLCADFANVRVTNFATEERQAYPDGDSWQLMPHRRYALKNEFAWLFGLAVLSWVMIKPKSREN